MKKLGFAAILLLLLGSFAWAESADELANRLELDGLQKLVDEADAAWNVREVLCRILTGEQVLNRDFLRTLWENGRDGALDALRGTFLSLLLPQLLSGVLTGACGDGGKAAEPVSRAVLLTVCLRILRESAQSCRALLDVAGSVTQTAVPVLAGLSALAGSSSAAVLTPAATVVGELIVNALKKWGIALCVWACVCACCCAIASTLRLDRLFSLFKTGVMLGCGLMMALFVGILRVQGLLSASFDSAAIKTAQFAIDKMIPAIGGGMADSLNLALSSVLLVRSAAGVTGMLALLSVAARPVLRLASMLLATHLAGAVSQSVASEAGNVFLQRFGDVLRMLLTLCLTALLLCLILLGNAIRAGGQIAS